jgi:hypothetical protein
MPSEQQCEVLGCERSVAWVLQCVRNGDVYDPMLYCDVHQPLEVCDGCGEIDSFCRCERCDACQDGQKEYHDGDGINEPSDYIARCDECDGRGAFPPQPIAERDAA